MTTFGIPQLEKLRSEPMLLDFSTLALSGSTQKETKERSSLCATRRANPGLTPQASTAFNPASNRLNSGLYDAAGNLTSDAAGSAFVYDAENKLARSTVGGVVCQYGYDGEGRRVKKVVGGATTIFVYDALGRLIADYSGAAASGAGTSYLFTDHLGSVRLVTDANGAVKGRHDYLPFGEEVGAALSGRSGIAGYTSNDGTRQKFTAKERDNESGLDYFGARYYSSAQGRFTSVDPANAGGTSRDPQSWNGYAYARNNPLLYVDPTGLYYEVYDSKGNLLGRVEKVEELDKLGYKFVKSSDNGNILHFEGGYTAKFFEDAPAPVNISLDRSDAFIMEMSRRAPAMNQAIGAFAGGTAIIGATGGAAAYFGGVALGGSGLTTLGLSEGGGTIAGLYGATTVATLQSLASSGGPTVQVVTNLTRAPAAGQGLSTATGPGAEALANSFARAGGQLFRAEIPKALIKELERVGLAEVKRHATGTEIRFLPQATRFITQFFK